jgi:hypothetical protein
LFSPLPFILSPAKAIVPKFLLQSSERLQSFGHRVNFDWSDSPHSLGHTTHPSRFSNQTSQWSRLLVESPVSLPSHKTSATLIRRHPSHGLPALRLAGPSTNHHERRRLSIALPSQSFLVLPSSTERFLPARQASSVLQGVWPVEKATES